MARDLLNNIHPVVALAPAVVADGTAQPTVIIDTQGYQSLTLIILLGVLVDADAEWSVTLSHGDAVDDPANPTTITDTAEVADEDLIGTEDLAGFTHADDGKTRKVGYVGGKRYVRAVIDDTTPNTGSAPMAALWLLGHPREAPTPNPPA